ncbi:MAG: hypothetical protein M1819_005167 [Sarea resinae]|nr:MAG: hypothetical protein M1819_005167 [Sarea resinae]
MASTGPAPSGLAKLPPEILLNVTSYLSFADQLDLRLSSPDVASAMLPLPVPSKEDWLDHLFKLERAQWPSHASGRPKLVCGDCAKLLPRDAFSDNQRWDSRSNCRFCIRCGVWKRRIYRGKKTFNNLRRKCFACPACFRAVPLENRYEVHGLRRGKRFCGSCGEKAKKWLDDSELWDSRLP